MFLARLEDPGLTVLPAHRALFNLADFDPKRFETDLNRYFNIERIDFDKKTRAADLRTVLETMEHRAERTHVFGMRVKGEHSYYLLTLRNEADMDAAGARQVSLHTGGWMFRSSITLSSTNCWASRWRPISSG